MSEVELCRCCLAEAPCKDLTASYSWLDGKEVYGDMLNDCFGINLTPSINSGICAACINELRNCCKFKKMVLKSDVEFIEKYNEICNLAVKQEVVDVKFEDDFDPGNDSDDYSLAFTAKRDTISKMGELKKQVKVKTEELIIGEGNHESTQKTKSKKPVCTSKSQNELKITDKNKQQTNLQNILKYSNVTLFTNKTVLGYTCAYCDTNFIDPIDLRAHSIEKHKKDRFNTLLIKRFKNKKVDISDYSLKVDIFDLACTICDTKIENLSLLSQHLVKQHKVLMYLDIKSHIIQYKLKIGDEYNCALCTNVYETFKMLAQHMNFHYQNYVCPVCCNAFANKRSYAAHKDTHLNGSFKCKYCEKTFASNSKKCYHEKQTHLKSKNIRNCQFCGISFRNYYQRNIHFMRVHKTEAPYKCKTCKNTYVLKSLLMNHIKKTHLMEKNIQCTECGYRFFSKKALKAHMVKHTGEKKYSCSVCNKAYARKYTLTEHMRIHNNDRRFKCSYCDLGFVQKCSLRSHLLSNHGVNMSAADIK